MKELEGRLLTRNWMNLFLSRSTKDVVKVFGCQENSKATVTYDERVKESESNEEFKPSTGWLKRFMKREGLPLQQKTSVAQKDPDQLIDKLVSFFTRLPSCHKTSIWCCRYNRYGWNPRSGQICSLLQHWITQVKKLWL